VHDPLDLPVVRAARDAIVGALDRRLVGLYVYGSLATGSFEPDVSDVDLIAVVTDEPDEASLAELTALHADLVRRHPTWDDRIEVDYVSSRGLATCRTSSTTIARIGPGEPLHLVVAGREFLLDWYPARRDAIVLVGPPIASLIPAIPESEYLDETRAYLATFRNRFAADASAGSQAYAIVTMCRGFYALRHGEWLSKRSAALRACVDFPRWRPLLDLALSWRERQWDREQPDASDDVHRSRAFVEDLSDRLGLDPSQRED
jgi:hypothetical protein